MHKTLHIFLFSFHLLNFSTYGSEFYFNIYTFTLLSHTIDKEKYINLCTFSALIVMLNTK